MTWIHRPRGLSGLGALSLVGVFSLIGLTVNHVSLGGVAVGISSIFLVGEILRDNRRRSDEYSRYCGEIAAQADQQNAWVMQGDDRGVFGPQGIGLMRRITSDDSASQAIQGERGSLPEVPTEVFVSSAGSRSGETLSSPPKPLSARRRALPAVVAGGGVVAVAFLSLVGTGPGHPTKSHPAHRLPQPAPEAHSPAPAASTTPPVAVPFVSPVRTTPYQSCEEAAKDNRYNILSNDPAYNANLDRDYDGVACEA